MMAPYLSPHSHDAAEPQPVAVTGAHTGFALMLVLALVSLFAFAVPAQAAPTQSASVRGARITPGQLVRFTQAGGFAYTHRVLSVDQIGRTTAVDTDGSIHRLQLSSSEVSTLRRALGRLSGLNGRRYLLPSSADTFVYQVVTANSTVIYEDGAARPAAVSAVDEILGGLLTRTLGS